jgi:phosphate acetyltransferase
MIITIKKGDFMNFVQELIQKAKTNKKRIVLPEGNDERILIAANEVLKEDSAYLSILGNPQDIKECANKLQLTHLEKATIIDYKKSPEFKDYATQYYEMRKSKGITQEEALKQLEDRNYFGVMMVYNKKADGMVSGADGTTADTIRPALSIIRTQKNCSIASSIFIMCLPDERIWIFGDCAINPNPNPSQIAEIAISSALTAKSFGIDPKVAILSYSSGSSGKGPDIDAAKEAVKIALDLRNSSCHNVL